MRDLLFLCQRIPYPPNKGEKIRAFRILDHLSRDYRIHLGCFIDDPADWAHRESLAPLCATAHFAGLDPTRAKLRCLTGLVRGQPLSLPYFRDAGLAAWTADVLDRVRPDVAFVYSSAMAQYLTKYLLAGDAVRPPRPRRVVMDFVDVDSDKWRQYAPTRSWPFSAIYRREAETLLRFDRAVAAAADAGLFVSEPESALFRGLAPESAPKIHTVANGIDAGFFDPGAAPGDVAMPVTGIAERRVRFARRLPGGAFRGRRRFHRRFGGFETLLGAVQALARPVQFVAHVEQAVALFQSGRGGGGRAGFDRQAVPAPQAAVTADQPLALGQAGHQARRVGALDHAHLRQPAGKRRRRPDEAVERLGAVRQRDRPVIGR